MNVLYLIYLVAGRPIVEGFELEVFNEITVMILSYLMLIFTDYVGEVDIKYYTGYLFISIFIFGVSLNIAIIIKDAITFSISKVKQILS